MLSILGNAWSDNMEINGRKIGDSYPCYVIAEMSANHNQDFDRAIKIIEAAKDAGADAIKLQTYTPDTMTIDCNNECFQHKNHKLWGGKSLYELYREAYTPWEWHKDLKKRADEIGITLFSTPFDNTSVDFLEELNCCAYKIASFELVDIPLLEKVASTHKPIIMSTGMASLEEIKTAVKVLRNNGAGPLSLLKCTSAYPAKYEDMNLNVMLFLKNTFDVVIGVSDHALGSVVAITAVALGAKIVEKHFMLSDNVKTPDSAFSMIPEDFKQMVEDIRKAEASLGKVSFKRSMDEEESAQFRKSIFAIKDIKKGEVFSADNIKVIRPGTGLSPSEYKNILGKKAVISIQRGTPINKNLF